MLQISAQYGPIEKGPEDLFYCALMPNEARPSRRQAAAFSFEKIFTVADETGEFPFGAHRESRNVSTV